MASMKELFPFYDTRKKFHRNFIRENIRNAKGCSQCINDKRGFNVNNQLDKSQTPWKRNSSKYLVNKNLKVPSVKCNLRMSRSKSDVTKTENNECQKKSFQSLESLKSISCQSCNQPVVVNINQNNKSTSTDDIESHSQIEKDDENVLNRSTDYHQLSHENEGHKLTVSLNKCLDLSCYKKGEVPEYLKKRNAKLKQELQDETDRKQIAKLLGLNDPKCPPGHMLMAKQQIEENLQDLEKRYQLLIQELNRMPVSCDTLKIRNRKIEIEKDLNRLDQEIELHKSGKVFIRIPD